MRKDYYSFILLYSFAYGAIGVMTPLIGQYLSGIGFSGTQVGLITSTATVVAIFAGIFWGRVYNNSKKPYWVVIFLCLMAGSVGLLVYLLHSFWLVLLMYGIMYFFQSPIMSLNDAMTMETRHSFGTIRMWGAIGFAVAAFFAGKISDMTNLSNIFPMYAACYGTAALSVLRIVKIGRKKDSAYGFAGMPGEQQEQNIKTDKKRYGDLLGNKKLICLIACTFFISGTNIANNTYFGYLYIQGGGTLAGIGLAFLLMAGSEAPFMGWSAKLSEKVTTEKLILISVIISVARFSWYATGPSAQWLLILFFLQGAVNGIILVEFVNYVATLAGGRLAGMAIAAYYVVSYCSTITCQLLGGVFLDRCGPGGVYLFFAAFNAVGVLMYIFFGLHKKGKERVLTR